MTKKTILLCLTSKFKIQIVDLELDIKKAQALDLQSLQKDKYLKGP